MKILKNLYMSNFNLSLEKLSISIGSKNDQTKLFDNLTFYFEPKKIYFILGQSGIGKTTLIQYLNGLKTTKNGIIKIGNNIIYSKRWGKMKYIKEIRKKIQLLFDFPENQLFKSTIIDDVMFGPRNFKLDEKKSYKIAKYYLNKLGIEDNLFLTSPFLLSKGQKRKVALAGILAIDPEIIVFDDPLIDLDSKTKKVFWQLINELKNQNKTIIIITHNTNDILKYGDEVLILHNKIIYANGKPWQIFNNKKIMNNLHFKIPFVIKLINSLPKKFNYLKNTKIINIDQLAQLINTREKYENKL